MTGTTVVSGGESFAGRQRRTRRNGKKTKTSSGRKNYHIGREETIFKKGGRGACCRAGLKNGERGEERVKDTESSTGGGGGGQKQRLFLKGGEAPHP